MTEYHISPTRPFLVAPDLCPVDFCPLPSAKVPVKAHDSDAGFDVFAYGGTDKEGSDEDARLGYVLGPKKRVLVRTGIKMAMERGWECQVRPRSGNALNLGLTVLNSPGTIDCAYRAEVGVILYNSSDIRVFVANEAKIAQLVFARVPTVVSRVVSEEEYTRIPSDRGANGFGSTGTK